MFIKKNIFLTLLILMCSPTYLIAQNASVKYDQVNPLQPPKDFIAITQTLKQPQLIRSNFIQAKYLKVLKKPFMSSGKLIFSRDKGVYWEMVQPLKTAYVINDHGMRSVSKKTDEVMPPASPISESVSRIFSSIIGGDIEKLSDTFNIFYQLDPDNTVHFWKIKLQPKDKLIAKVLASITLSGSEMINEITIAEKSGDRTHIAFNDMLRDEGVMSAIELGYFGG